METLFQCRELARVCRAIAAGVMSREASAGLIEMADGYDRISEALAAKQRLAG